MATKDEALLMAIEAMETAEIQSEYDGLSNLIFKAIKACKEALEHPAQYKWSAYGERRVKCGDKDWINKEQK